ncbi:hypothetical protein COE15_00130 [Bacillus cereus]|nr:hypothetical protein COE15_00130 [Bacillus cereus]
MIKHDIIKIDDALKSNPDNIEEIVQQLFEGDSVENQSLRPEVVREVNYLYENVWMGLFWYLHRYTGEWIQAEPLVEELNEKVQEAESLEEAATNAIYILQSWGEQVVFDFMGTLCMLEADLVTRDGKIDELLHIIRTFEGSYSGYVREREKQLVMAVDEDIQPGMGYYIAQPIIQEAPAFAVWVQAVLQVALDQRRGLIKDALSSISFKRGSYEEFILKISMAIQGVIEDTALLCGYIAVKVFQLQRYYTFHI